ncbi:sigma-70 family RNA polymerase sigma factor [Brevundimonas sp.]|uniref:sigma-70 family RNA polymerase sigma factor n=1 Tax=Brevundimonas sp. TaxID=1871086 RepID=UPI0025BFA05E|nr:sigma-70 family RNA polymerase sigma factor [Brevundimonas sp.]
MIQTFVGTVLGSMDGQVSTLQRIRPPVTAMGGEHDRLIEAVALRRDREAFARLFEHFAPRLKAYLMKAGAPAGAAEDFAQDAMLTVWRKAELFDSSKARAATWIFTIARNRRLDVLRQDARRTPMPEIELSQEEPERPDQLVLMAEDAARLKTAMARLTADQIEVLRLAFFQDNPHSEIARRLDLPLGTVKSRIRKAMIKLRTLLDDAGGEA